MIARVWHGWTSRDNADSYQRLLEEEIIPAIAARGLAGVDGPVVLRRDAGDDEVEPAWILSPSSQRCWLSS